ncbi:hypothetical protein L6164_021711 [Bauhinia variegata]|uniref:Uncharacterized protein n=1 Tax=Bauhinia variegata TaxID=167791 RepID=A0ACB9N0J2_BAUVA|nr:hypothetical protein L6164_021711 [Bauhinia variegata]
MGTFKCSSCRGMDYRLGLLSFAVCLVFFGAVSRIFNFNIPRGSVSKLQHLTPKAAISKGKGYPPVLAYWISGSKGESKKMERLLKAIYHPRNQYLLQLDDSSSESERLELALSVQSHKVFEAFGNVNVVGKSYAINKMGCSALSSALHAAALLLKINADWDWFITLSASDYPLSTQDDILHALTFLPKDINLIHYTNKTIRKEQRDINQIVVDPSLHEEMTSPLFFAVESRDAPDAFQIFTVLCNSPEFNNTTVDNRLLYTLWDTDPSEFQKLDLSHYDRMLETGAAFARPFDQDDLILDKIDDLILNRSPNGLVPGEWCSADQNFCSANNSCCSSIDTVNPGSYGINLATLLAQLVKSSTNTTSQCQKL